MYPLSLKTDEQEVLSAAVEWLRDGHQVDLVTVANTWGSSPRPPGSMAAVRDDGVLVGSVSGGCIEKQLSEAFRKDQGESVFTHHIDDESARRFGLTCGGKLELLFERIEDAQPLQQILAALQQRQRLRRTVDIATGVATLEDADLDAAFAYNGETLVRVFGPQWRVLLVGAGQLSRYTAEFAQVLDFDVQVCDPREEFRQGWQVESIPVLSLSPDDAVLQLAMDEQSAVLALTHDPNHDDLALVEALGGKAFYVGALGSRKNHERRAKRLVALGAEVRELERIHGPVGLDIGSRTSAEIAISIVADLIQCRSKANTR
ncbi:MAG: XdhC family protein [Gammaproteobacteria bacterium]|nr:XdhC family protein [Gammaproteobacteria bacterium]